MAVNLDHLNTRMSQNAVKCDEECPSSGLNTEEKLSIFVIMTVKRMVDRCVTELDPSFVPSVQALVKEIMDVKSCHRISLLGFVDTLRDHARIYCKEWSGVQGHYDRGRLSFNSILLVVALLAGMEKMWHSDGSLIQEELAQHLLMELGTEKLTLKELSQEYPIYDFLFKHTTTVKKVRVTNCNNSIFRNTVTYRFLREIEFSGVVSDKVLCNCLWNVDWKSEKVLLGKIKGNFSSRLALPHLRALRGNIDLEDGRQALKESLGAAALAIQPEMEEISSHGRWDTYDAVCHLIETTKAHPKNGSNHDWSLNVVKLRIPCNATFDAQKVKAVVKACPELSSLVLSDTGGIYEKWSLMRQILPLESILTLQLDVLDLNSMQFKVILSSMLNLDELTLVLRPETLINLKPIEQVIDEDDAESWKELVKFPVVKTLKIDFLRNHLSFMDEWDGNEECTKNFFQCFPFVNAVYLNNTIVIPPFFLVKECVKSCLKLMELEHLSLMAYDPDHPRHVFPHNTQGCPETLPKPGHRKIVGEWMIMLKNHFLDKEMEKLVSLEVDEVYVNRHLDTVIQALRLTGVLVRVHYRSLQAAACHGCVGAEDSDEATSEPDLSELCADLVKESLHMIHMPGLLQALSCTEVKKKLKVQRVVR